MSELAEFLLARIAEDEAAARAVPPLGSNFDMGGNRQDERFTFDRSLPSSADGMGNWSEHRNSPTTRDHFARHDPARVLAECEAKRRIVEQMQRAEVILESEPMSERVKSSVTIPHAYWMASKEAVRFLALPYADHADYRGEWKP